MRFVVNGPFLFDAVAAADRSDGNDIEIEMLMRL